VRACVRDVPATGTTTSQVDVLCFVLVLSYDTYLHLSTVSIRTRQIKNEMLIVATLYKMMAKTQSSKCPGKMMDKSVC
jgi:hypothetical protein